LVETLAELEEAPHRLKTLRLLASPISAGW